MKPSDKTWKIVLELSAPSRRASGAGAEPGRQTDQVFRGAILRNSSLRALINGKGSVSSPSAPPRHGGFFQGGSRKRNVSASIVA